MEVKELINIALKARELAQAPYSNFKVGAALLCKSGEVFTGSNVESSSYGLTICAERVALVKALSEGETDFESMTVVSAPGAALCGACRQLLWDYAKDIPLYLSDLHLNYVEFNLSDLLPRPFDNSQLTKNDDD